MIQLTELLDRYLAMRKLSEGAAYQMRRSLALFTGQTTDDFTDLFVSRWLASLEATYAPWTLSGHRTRILCLWRFAARHGWATPPGEVRRETPPEPMPDTWTIEELGRLIATCPLVDGGHYLRPLILAGYETALRRSDLWGLHRSQIAVDGLVSLRQHKTGRCHEPRMRRETADEVLSLKGDYPLACPWGPRAFYNRFAELRRLANVGEGALQQLRRTGATEVARESGISAASAFLGHRSPGMVWHYVARSAVAKPYLPPRVA